MPSLVQMVSALSDWPWESVAEGLPPAATRGASSKHKRQLVDATRRQQRVLEDLHVRNAQVHTGKKELETRLAAAWTQRVQTTPC